MLNDSDMTVGKGTRMERNISREGWFIASRDPFYIGIILPPDPGLWALLSSSKEITVSISGETRKFSVRQRIEVGSNSIFFLKLEDIPFSDSK